MVKRPRLNPKLLLAIVLPAFGLLYFATDSLLASYHNFQRARALGEKNAYLARATTLIRELQRERDIALRLLDDPSLLQSFRKQQESSDRVIKGYQAILLRSIPSKEQIRSILQKLHQLPALRKEAHRSSWEALYRSYSQLIQAILATFLPLEALYAANPNLFTHYQSLLALLETIEWAIRARDLGSSPTFLQDPRHQEVLRQIDLEYRKAKERFLNVASPQILLLYNRLLSQGLERQFQEAKARLLANPQSYPRWRLVATRYVEALYTLERAIFKGLSHQVQKLQERESLALLLTSLLWIASIGAFLWLVGTIKRLFNHFENLFERLKQEQIFYKTLAQFSEQVLFAQNLNALVNIYAIYLFKTGLFEYLFLVDERNNPVVAEGISIQQIKEEILHTIERGLAQVKAKKRHLIFTTAQRHQVLLLPIIQGERLLYISVLFLRSQGISHEFILDLATKMDEHFLFAYRFLQAREEREALQRELELLRYAFDAQEAITITDHTGRIIKVNRAFERITGYKEAEVLGKNPNILKSGRHDQEFYRQMWATIKEEGHWKGEIYNKRKDGSIYPELLSISAIKDAQGNTTHYIAHFFDISELKAAQESIEFSANHDLLTHFFNRKRFIEELETIYKEARRQGRLGALFYIDIDDFKYINDTYGHDVGDQLLKAFAARLHQLAGPEDILARLGGDEFALIVPALAFDQQEAAQRAIAIAKRILQSFSKPLAIEDRLFEISLSIGIALFPQRERDAKELITNADIAMYHAKRNGKNQFVLFDERLDHASKEYLIIKQDLERALKEGELFLVYQPKVRIKDSAIVGFEALLRWNHPSKGILTPNRFLFAAQGNRLGFEIDRFVLEESCRMIRRLGYRYPISVNISAEQFNNNSFLQRMGDLLAHWPKERELLEFEIVEDALVKDLKRAKEIIAQLKELGISFSIDDFGIGYSSLSYLEQLDVEALKIDRSFILNIFEPRKREIVRLILQTSKIFDMICIAEGVENSRILKLLEEMGFEYYQGYYFSRPIPQEEVLRLVQQQSHSTLSA
ncbi:MAG: hypothetical protein C6I00_02760 [Nitratiruptor sp.]|nr:hypothetical protein [Nitratiruptor sp.]NPA82871.1 EAL domain-containing protein [Campylobacterota bacterium]